jgi:hypothetical protein
MNPTKQVLFISIFAVVSSAQASPITIDSDITKQAIYSETYVSAGAMAIINGDIKSRTYATIGAATVGAAATLKATVNGNVESGTYTSTGALATVNGNVKSGTYASTGANAAVNGNISSGSYATFGSGTVVQGNVQAQGIVTLDPTVRVTGGAEGGLGGQPPPVTSLQLEILAQQQVLKALGGTLLMSGFADGSVALTAGVYNVLDILKVAAHTKITLDGGGDDRTWVFNIGNHMDFGAGVNVVLNDVGDGSSIIWNVLGDSTGTPPGPGLGYASLGAGADFKGTILSTGYISAGAGAKMSGVGDSCGGAYSAFSYVSLGADAVFGSEGCGASVPVPGTIWLLGLGLFGLASIKRVSPN